MVDILPDEQTGSPVFICGYPKSGTTLMLALLDRHPGLLVFPEESKFLSRIMGHPENQNLEYVLTRTGANVLRFGEVQFPSGYRDYSNLDFTRYEQELLERWNTSDRTDRALLESVIFSYGNVTDQTGKQYWIEKTPGNEFFLEDALVRWPDLKAIYILRDPRDNYCSYRKQKHKRLQDLPLESFIANLCESICAWEQFAAQRDSTLLVRYDDLVKAPQVIMQRICKFLQIDWDDILLQPTRNGVPWSGNSMYQEKFEQVSESPVGRYRSVLTPSEIHFLET